MDKAARKAEVEMQRQLEIEEDEAYEFIDRWSGKPFVCNAETKADLEANMYDHCKRVIFSQKMLKAMSLERTFWQNWRWEDGPRNGQVNGVSFNAESTETWEELQAAEDKAKGKQQPRRHRNNKRRAQKKLVAKAKTQQLKAELAGWGKVVALTSTKDGDEGVMAAWKGTRAAMKWWLRRGKKTEDQFEAYAKTMAKIKKECPQVWGVISRWAEVYFKTVVTGEGAPTNVHLLDEANCSRN